MAFVLLSGSRSPKYVSGCWVQGKPQWRDGEGTSGVDASGGAPGRPHAGRRATPAARGRPRRRAARGEPLRDLRQRHPHGARGLGPQGVDRRPRVVGPGRGRGRRGAGVVGGRRRGRRPPPDAGAATTAWPAARAVHGPGHPAPGPARARSPATSAPERLAPEPARRHGPACRRPHRAAGRGHARHDQRGVQGGQRVLVTGAGPIGLLTIAALRAKGSTTWW